MDNSALLNYALRRRNLLAAVWLTLQQRWFVHSFNSSARVFSWMVIALGMALVTFTVVTIARNVVPVLTTPSTLPYLLLQLLVLIVSFNIYVNYFCATVFSMRVGRAPADYVYRDPYNTDPTAPPPRDDSTESASEESGEPENEEEDVRAAVSGGDAVHPLYRIVPPFHLSPQHQQPVGVDMAGHNVTERSADAHVGTQQTASGVALPFMNGLVGAPLRRTPTAATKRFGGIQVVRVFGEESSPSCGTTHNSNDHVDGSMQNDVALPHRTSTSSKAFPYLDDVLEEEAECDGDIGEGRNDREARISSSLNCFSSTRLGVCVSQCWRRWFPLRGARGGRRPLLRTCATGCNRLSSNTCIAAASSSRHTVASAVALRELESLAYAAERLGPRQRAFHVLDPPRRYCSHCRRLKAPREHHCAICNECVAKMDHHCPWINNCVDVENQRYFLLFIFWLWVGTFLASAFVGYGATRQHCYTARRSTLYAQWLRSPGEEALARELQRLHMPYGPAGVLLTSYPTTMVLCISVAMFFSMTLFLYFNRRLVLENTTVIESIYVDEKRRHVYRSTSFLYRNPYDLGCWLNFLDMFSPAGDPVVKKVTDYLQPHDSGGGASPDRPTRAESREGRRWWSSSRLQAAASRVSVVLWLTAFPTFRPTHSDGVHYSTFDALASGEQTSLMRT